MTTHARRPGRAVQPQQKGRASGGLITRSAELQPSSWNPEARTIEVIWSTGADVRRDDWDGDFIERLSMDPAHVRLGRLNAGASVLDAHASWSLRDVIGAVIPGSARIENGLGYATLRLSENPDHAGIVADIVSGVIRHISVGYLTHTEVRTAGEGGLQIRTATDWEPHELSFVPVPADAGAHSRAFGARSMNENAKLIMAAIVAQAGDSTPLDKVYKQIGKDSGLDPAAVGAIAKGEQEATAEELAALATALGLTFEVKLGDGEAEAPKGEDPAKPAEPAAAVSATQAAAPVAGTQAADPVAIRAAELTRTNGILNLARVLGLDMTEAQQHIASARSLEEIREMTINARAAAGDANRPRSAVQVVTDHGEQVRDGIQNALAHRYTQKTELTPAGRSFMGDSILDMGAAMYEQATGERLRGSRPERIRKLMQTRVHSTSDFPLVLANVQHSRLLEAYAEEGINFEAVGTKATLPDLKTVSRVSIGEFPALSTVAEGADYTYGTIGERREQYALVKYGKLLALTEEMLINDDLNAFMQAVDAAGFAAARVQKDVFWGLLTTNANMSDGQPFFSAAHANLTTGPGTVFTATNLGLARAMMRVQTGIDGQRIAIYPTHIVAGVDSENLIDQILNGQYFPTTAATGTTQVMRSLQVITDPRLDANPDPWYLAAGKRGIEYGYLEGEESPQLTEETEWRNDSITWKVKLRFAAKTLDHRYWYRNVGA